MNMTLIDSFTVLCRAGQTVDSMIEEIKSTMESMGSGDIYSVNSSGDKGKDWANFRRAKSVSDADADRAFLEVDSFLIRDGRYERSCSHWGAPRYEPAFENTSKRTIMDFFGQDVKKLSPWQALWALAWPNDEWHKKMLDKDLVPALSGYDIHAFEKGKITFENTQELRLVLGLVRQKKDCPENADKSALEDLLQSLRRNEGKMPVFDKERSEVVIPGSPKIRMYIGLHDGKLWPELLEDPSAFILDHGEGPVGTSLVYYSDAEQKVHVQLEPYVEVFRDGSFVADFPEKLCGEDHAAWSVQQAGTRTVG